MSDHPNASAGYVVVDRGPTSAPNPLLDAAVLALDREGWKRALAVDGLEIFLCPSTRLKATQVHRRHFLIGDWQGDGTFLSALVGGHRSPLALATAVVTHGWGRYVFVWRDDDGRLRVLRDPSGALDCIGWAVGPTRLVTDQPPAALDPVLPDDLAIDWLTVGEIAETINLASDRLALEGMEAVLPGNLATISTSVEQTSVWNPVAFCRRNPEWDERPEALVEVVDKTVAALVGPHERILAEISGGLDSAIVASSLVAGHATAKAKFLTFHDDQPEGDERMFARAAAETFGVTLTEVHKPIAAVSGPQLSILGQGVRPGLHGMDVIYDADVARRAIAGGASGLLTGQGGDAVFFQSADPMIAADRLRREGLRGLDLGYMAALGRWTRHSMWTIARHAILWRPPPTAPSGRRHGWMTGTEDLPPAKARQVQQFANCQMFWGDCRRARAATLLHPLLTQPVVEHCLRIPADRLTQGVRDRGLARLAFADRLPAMITARRDKGDLSRFYSRVVRESAPFLNVRLAEGRLQRAGIVDAANLSAALTDANLVWDPAATRFLVLAVLETWVCHWEGRIARVRRAKITVQPGEDARVEIP